MSALNNYKPGYHELVAGYLVKKCGWTPIYADAVVADAIRFLSVCADHPEEHLVPSDDVDAVVDTIVLDTELLRWLEADLGRRVVHIPSYTHDPIGTAKRDVAYSITLEYMRSSGPVDAHMWRDPAGCWTSCRLMAA